MTCKDCEHAQLICLKKSHETVNKMGLPILTFINQSDSCEGFKEPNETEINQLRVYKQAYETAFTFLMEHNLLVEFLKLRENGPLMTLADYDEKEA